MFTCIVITVVVFTNMPIPIVNTIKLYLQPERINPMEVGAKYDQRSDVWSFGITMVGHHTCTGQDMSNLSSFSPTQFELALGRFPYHAWKNVFEQLKTVVEGEAPRLSEEDSFSPEFKDFLHLW